jgi:hypothetical protein
MGLRRRIKNVLLQYKFDREARKAVKRRHAEIDALVRKSK